MILSVFVLLFLTSLSHLCFGQKIVKCRVEDRVTHESLAYTLVYSMATQKEFLADEVGCFFKNMTDLNDTLIVSSLGYWQAVVPVSHLLLDSCILLSARTYELHEVPIQFVNNPKIKKLGYFTNKPKGHKCGISIDAVPKGMSFTFNCNKPVKILSIRFWLSNISDNPVPLRVAFYERDSLHGIGAEITGEPLVISEYNKGSSEELIELDVSRLNIEMPLYGVYVQVKALPTGEEFISDDDILKAFLARKIKESNKFESKKRTSITSYFDADFDCKSIRMGMKVLACSE